jgi:hypothetical protein
MEIKPISLKSANEFVKKFHRHNGCTAGNGGKFAISLYYNNEMIGVAIAGRPIARELNDDESLEILRVCVLEGYSNGCSMLYGRCAKIAKLMGYKKIYTYSLKTESQSSLKAIGAKPFPVKGHSWNNRPNRQIQMISLLDKWRWELV